MLSAIFLAAFVCPTGDSGEAAREFPKASLSSAAFFLGGRGLLRVDLLLVLGDEAAAVDGGLEHHAGRAANAAPSAFISL